MKQTKAILQKIISIIKKTDTARFSLQKRASLLWYCDTLVFTGTITILVFLVCYDSVLNTHLEY